MLASRLEGVNEAQWGLVTKMCAKDPTKRVNISFAVARLKQFALDNQQIRERSSDKPPNSNGRDENGCEGIDKHVFAELQYSSIPEALQQVFSKCEQFPDDPWMSRNVYPAFEVIFRLLREGNKTSGNVEVVLFCTTLSNFKRYLRVAWTMKTKLRYTRSRKVAETHHVVYSELDRLLDMLGVSPTHQIRVWRQAQDGIIEKTEVKSSVSFSLACANESVTAISLSHLGTPSSHGRWTQFGLSLSTASPPWYISLRDLVFRESDAIGKGSFGTVYKGSWQDTPVVVKFMGYEADDDTISTDLLLHEVRVWHRLNHPHILKFYGACHVDKRYFVCEHCPNGDLQHFLNQRGNQHLKWQKLYEVALGLEYLHGQNVIHNDLKCDNILVGVGGKSKLIDFGLSWLVNEAEIQVDVLKMGAENWRSPEYLRGERVTFASDVYSLAMCIIEAVSGVMPWGLPKSAAQLRFQWKRGNTPNLPESVNNKQRNLIRLMSNYHASDRVKMPYVVNTLNEIAQNERASALSRMKCGPSR